MRNRRILAFLLFVTAALHCEILEGMDSIEGKCNDEIILPCKATDQTDKYRYAIWRKKNTHGAPDTPIIKKKNHNITHYYMLTSVSLKGKESLELHNVMPSDSGVYECYLAADVGGRNQASLIRLNISECVHVRTVYPTTMVTNMSCPAVVEFSVPWAVLGLSLFSLAKIILCIVAVGVCDQVIFKRLRRKQDVRGSKRETSSCKD
ncbi:uncharacterized protein LOC127424264 isoform X2 [Myxocyprinus asiaticus]|uniref:uncharacterized protein LOC127424264 isoform X2 n=1 Tax=Myxocyprinus asiaticus TaxID=70543 RepID=UPI002222718D|nr:uncharacterized protein LOC127424264 isoform X2 [Myxocyprinus asiaticus]